MDEFYAGFCVGVFSAFIVLVLLVLVAPDRKADCDSLGMTRWGNTAYECHPKK